MARIRSIHPDACDSEKLASVSADAERLYWRLQTHCDDRGRCEDNPRLIWARCVPLVDGWTAKKADSALDELAHVGLIDRYRVGGVAYLAVCQWSRFQHPQKLKESGLPSPEEADDIPLADESRIGTVSVSSGGEGSRRGEGEGVGASLVPLRPEPSFDDFWSAYPRKVSKDDARRAWAKATRRTSPTVIVAGLTAQLPGFRSKDPEYIPHAATWLNGSRWEDTDTAPPPLGRNQGVLETLAGVQ